MDIAAGNELVRRLGPALSSATRQEVLGSVGGFAALCGLPQGYREPVLVSACDGVGTKLKLALDWAQPGGLGIDLVAMCANDVLVSGGEPLFFLDYYASARLDLELATQVIDGIASGCKLAGCALVGGETAEMPGLYSGTDFDLAGFCVGIAERERLPGPQRVGPGDSLIALPSSGPHANGYSLIRQVLSTLAEDPRQELLSDGRSLGETLLAPTRIYSSVLTPLLADNMILSAAHITGGGVDENLPRALPSGTTAIVQAMPALPPVFAWLQSHGDIATAEMRRVFNCGVGMVLCVAREHSQAVLRQLHSSGESAWVLGTVGEAEAEQTATVTYREAIK